MSFILDALKKSENERQKQSGPALFEVKVAPPPRRFPVWAVVVGALLGVNLIVLVAVLLLRDRSDPAVQATQAQIATAAATAAAAPATPSAAPSAPPGAYAPLSGSAAAPSPGVAPGATQGAVIGPDGLPVAGSPAAGPALGTPTAGAPPGALPSAPAAATRFNPPLIEEDPSLDELPAPAAPRGTPVNPADYTPAAAGPPQMPQPAGYPIRAGTGPAAPPGRGTSNVRTATALPSRDDLMASGVGDLPPAAVGLHVYDPNPGARFVFVNGTRAREGDTLPNGLRVDEINAEGTVLSFRGSRFLVPNQ